MRIVPVEWCLTGRSLGEPRLNADGTLLGYLVGDGSASALMVRSTAGDAPPARALTSHPAPRMARAFGGGIWDWVSGGAGEPSTVYLATDGQLWLQPLAAGPRRLTDHDPTRSAAGVVAGPHGSVLYTLDEAEVWRASVDGSGAERLDRGADDFVLDPWPLASGGAQWLAWNVPSMPWDTAKVVQVDERGEPFGEVVPRHSIQQPRTTRDGELVSVRDDDGWLNVAIGDTPVAGEPFEHAGPAWGSGNRSYACAPGGQLVAFTRNEGGFGRLCVADRHSGTVTEIARGVHGQLSWSGDTVAALRSGARTPPQVVLYRMRGATATERDIVDVASVYGWDGVGLAEPECYEVPGPGGQVPVRRYRPAQPTGRALCWVHGGPTDQWAVTFMPRIAYWQSRGWDVIVPDHRGSTGHGRAFQQALAGQWGVADVDDVAAVILHAQAASIAAPDHTFLIGGSAGGFAALGVAARGDVPLAGVVAAYPVTDLVDLGERSHRFERHYNDTLLGPPDTHAERSRRRSPIHRAHELAATPVLLLHGDADPVVPVDHSQRLAAALTAAGGHVELVVFPGEGHGFRAPEHQRAEFEAIERFIAAPGSGR